jgi:predicted MFS family arabinose efflux permease
MTEQDRSAAAGPPLTRGLVLLFAVAAGLAVGNLYYAQPLLAVIAREFHSPGSAVGGLVTATQLGYAVGIFLLLPLGDLHDRRRFIPIMMLLSALALAACAFAPDLPVLMLASAVVGATTIAGQALTPLAGDMADSGSRGRAVGVVASGILSGIVVSRTVSGLVGGLAGWRIVYLAAAVLAVALAVVLNRRIPHLPAKTRSSYGALLASVVGLVARERALQVSMLLGAIGFAIFTLFWTSLTFLLAAPPFRLPAQVIGLFGIAGLLGTVAAQGAGRLHDRGRSVPATGVAWLLVLVALLIGAISARSIPGVIVAIVLLDVGVQGQHILNQNRIFAASPDARSRSNTAYVTGNFAGGAIGSLLVTLLWGSTGWTGVTLTAAALASVGLGVWAWARRGALVPR